jgi:signal transduction histidine kinase
MQKHTVPQVEKERLDALREYGIREMEAGLEFEELALLASEICQTPMALIALIDEEREWFKAGINLPADGISRKMAFCSHNIKHRSDPLIIPDLRKDKRFAAHPFVTGDPHLVFYAGVSLTNPDGYVLGALCVVDRAPKKLSDSQIRSLQILSRQIVQLLELHKANIRLQKLKEELEARNEELRQFAYVVSHDIKSPLSSIVLSSEMLRENFGEFINEENDQLLNVLNRATFKIRNLVDSILSYYRAEIAISEGAEYFQLKPFLVSIVEMLKGRETADIIFPEKNPRLYINKTALEQVLVNLLQNAINFNDKKEPQVFIRFSEDESKYYFSVSDNGNGIAEKDQEKIFDLFTTPGVKDRFGAQGAGIGLSTVKKLVEKMSGKVEVKSVPGQGSEFLFEIGKMK